MDEAAKRSFSCGNDTIKVASAGEAEKWKLGTGEYLGTYMHLHFWYFLLW